MKVERVHEEWIKVQCQIAEKFDPCEKVVPSHRFRRLRPVEYFVKCLIVRGWVLISGRLSDVQRIGAREVFSPDAAALLQLADQMRPDRVVGGRDARADHGNAPPCPNGLLQGGEKDVVGRWGTTCLAIHRRLSEAQPGHRRARAWMLPANYTL